jgi:hypothetical protein
VSDPSTAIAAAARPRLPRGVRLVHNEAQGGWVLLAPERVFKADAIAAEIIKRCTGEDHFSANSAMTSPRPIRRRARKSSRTLARCCAVWPTKNSWKCDKEPS